VPSDPSINHSLKKASKRARSEIASAEAKPRLSIGAFLCDDATMIQRRVWFRKLGEVMHFGSQFLETRRTGYSAATTNRTDRSCQRSMRRRHVILETDEVMSIIVSANFENASAIVSISFSLTNVEKLFLRD